MSASNSIKAFNERDVGVVWARWTSLQRTPTEVKKDQGHLEMKTPTSSSCVRRHFSYFLAMKDVQKSRSPIEMPRISTLGTFDFFSCDRNISGLRCLSNSFYQVGNKLKALLKQCQYSAAKCLWSAKAPSIIHVPCM